MPRAGSVVPLLANRVLTTRKRTRIRNVLHVRVVDAVSLTRISISNPPNVPVFVDMLELTRALVIYPVQTQGIGLNQRISVDVEIRAWTSSQSKRIALNIPPRCRVKASIDVVLQASFAVLILARKPQVQHIPRRRHRLGLTERIGRIRPRPKHRAGRRREHTRRTQAVRRDEARYIRQHLTGNRTDPCRGC